MLLEKTISQFTTLKDVKWGACPLCGKDDVLLVKEKEWHCYSCGLGGDIADFLIYKMGMTPGEAEREVKKLTRKQQPGKRKPGRPRVKKGE